MNLCLCPNCASLYKALRADTDKLNDFLEEIMYFDCSSTNTEIQLDFPADFSIRFTPTHLAEVKEMLLLINESNCLQEDVSNHVQVEEIEEEGFDNSNISVQSSPGFRLSGIVYHTQLGNGVIKKLYDGKAEIDFENYGKRTIDLEYSVIKGYLSDVDEIEVDEEDERLNLG